MPGKPEKVSYEMTPYTDLTKGMHTAWVISKERNDADEVNMGICHHDKDMADLVWDQKIDEIFYCAAGQLKVYWNDSRGNKGEMTANPGEAIFLPRDYHYVLTKTGVDSINVFTHKGRDLSNHVEYSAKLKALKK